MALCKNNKNMKYFYLQYYDEINNIIDESNSILELKTRTIQFMLRNKILTFPKELCKYIKDRYKNRKKAFEYMQKPERSPLNDELDIIMISGPIKDETDAR